MKKLLIMSIALLSLHSTAKVNTVAFPQLTVFPNSVEVRVWNNSEKNIQCSGSIFIYTQMNRFRSEFYNRIIPARQFSYQRFPNWTYNDPYRNAHHSIFCRELR